MGRAEGQQLSGQVGGLRWGCRLCSLSEHFFGFPPACQVGDDYVSYNFWRFSGFYLQMWRLQVVWRFLSFLNRASAQTPTHEATTGTCAMRLRQVVDFSSLRVAPLRAVSTGAHEIRRCGPASH